MPNFSRCTLGAQTRRAAFVLAAVATLFAAATAHSTVTISYCQGHGVETFTICVVVCCPGDLVPVELCCTTPLVNCSDPGAVMAAIDACMDGFVYKGMKVFGPKAVVGSPVGGQERHEYPLDPAYAAAGCCVIGGGPKFRCGTMSFAVDCPCDKPGGPPPGPGPFKLGVFGPPPPGPSTLVVWFIGCPPVSVPLDGTESPADVRAKLLAALLAAGYTAFINSDGEVEVLTDCTGGAPLGVDEYGLAGGAPMALGLAACPPVPPVGVQTRTWGQIKSLYH